MYHNCFYYYEEKLHQKQTLCYNVANSFTTRASAMALKAIGAVKPKKLSDHCANKSLKNSVNNVKPIGTDLSVLVKCSIPYSYDLKKFVKTQWDRSSLIFRLCSDIVIILS